MRGLRAALPQLRRAPREEHAEDARLIAEQREDEQLGHEPMRALCLLEVGADVLARRGARPHACGEIGRRERHLDLVLELAERGEILIEALAIVGAERRFEASSRTADSTLLRSSVFGSGTNGPSLGSKKSAPNTRP